MPTTSVSGALSTSIYFVSMFLLLGLLIPPTRGAYEDGNVAAARHLAEGIAGQIDEMSPGMTSVLRFSSFPGVAQSVSLSGHSVTATVGGFSASSPVIWALHESRLFPDRSYEIEIVGGELQIA